MNYESKQTQYSYYVRNGGTMTMQQWEDDSRYDRSLAGPIFCFESDMPGNCFTVDQMKAVIKCRFQKELDEFFDKHIDNGEERRGL
jgi:hypothetical protein